MPGKSGRQTERAQPQPGGGKATAVQARPQQNAGQAQYDQDRRMR
ncbi:MAG: hypothetical protein ACR65O_06810 [Methylomicrobium sp.]